MTNPPSDRGALSLPPLPEPDGNAYEVFGHRYEPEHSITEDVWTRTSVEAYATAAVLADRAARQEPVARGERTEDTRDPKNAPGGEQIWSVKIGGRCAGIPDGSDAPMREAVRLAYGDVTGYEPEFIFSGWSAELTEIERAVVENRLPATPTSDLRAGLTDAQIFKILDRFEIGLELRPVEFIRAIERAHGIGTKGGEPV